MERSIVYRNDFVAIYKDDRDIVSLKNLKGGAVVLPITQDKKVILLNIYRKVIHKYVFEAPRGYREKGENTRVTAERELMEEISGKSDHYLSLGSVYPDTGLIDGQADLYLALNTILVQDGLQAEEGIHSIHIIDFYEAYQMAVEGKITDGYTIAALMRSRRYVVD